jgi:hypothetical protein
MQRGSNRTRLGRLAVAFALVGLCACSHKKDYQPPVLGERPEQDAGAAGSSAPAFPGNTGINSTKLTVTGVEPGTGPFSGGTSATLRGSGFDDSVTIHIGGVAVQPGEIKRDGKNRITIVVPAGTVGPADIEVTRGDTTVVLPRGFLYNALAVSPNQGSISGGSLVELKLGGVTFPEDVVVEFDGAACTELRINSPQSATCKTPAHSTGIVDVIARSASGSSSSDPLLARNAYEFIETFDANGGGLSGGPITGTLNITVVADGAVSNVIPGALVMVGNDPMTARRGLTDKRGSITFSNSDLRGPVTVHASARCFCRSSIVDLDAKDVTVFLEPSADPACAADGDFGAGTKQLAATVSGELIFPGHEEFDVNTWEVIPKPKLNEERVVYVMTTQTTYDARRIPPDGGPGDISRLTEANAIPGRRGYVYHITSRPGGLAVFALGGLERTDTREFTPYVMGIAHNVVTSPGEETREVDMSMTITLDRELGIVLSDLPSADIEALDEFRVRAHVDVGGEGLLVRDINGASLDTIRRRTGSEPFRFLGQPAFVGGLLNATYQVVASYQSSDLTGVPYTKQKRNGVRQSSEPVRFENFLSVPTLVNPTLGARIPDDRTLRFDLTGPKPDMILVQVYAGDNLAWDQILPGDARAIPLPDFSLIEGQGQADLPQGFLQWVVTAVKINDFRYNELQHTYLTSNRYWTHESRAAFFARR